MTRKVFGYGHQLREGPKAGKELVFHTRRDGVGEGRGKISRQCKHHTERGLAFCHLEPESQHWRMTFKLELSGWW